MKQALEELRKIIQIPDQKHWNYVEIREKALEDWMHRWVIQLEYEQHVLDQKFLTSEFEDFLKEHVGKKLTEQAMEDAIEIVKEKQKIKGCLICIKRKAKS